MQQLRFVSSPPDALFAVQALRQHPDGVSGRMELGVWALGPDGDVALGSLGVLADNVLGYALMASLPQGSWSISTEIWIDLVGRLPQPGEPITASSRPVQVGSFAAGQLCDGAGRVIAECRQRGRGVVAGELEPDVGQGLSERVGRRDLASLLGLRTEGAAELLESAPALLNPRRMLHGGVSLAASDVVAAASRLAAGCTLPTTSIHIVHTRGVPAGATVRFAAETRYAGRSLVITDVAGSVDGRTCTLATVTADASVRAQSGSERPPVVLGS